MYDGNAPLPIAYVVLPLTSLSSKSAFKHAISVTRKVPAPVDLDSAPQNGVLHPPGAQARGDHRQVPPHQPQAHPAPSHGGALWHVHVPRNPQLGFRSRAGWNKPPSPSNRPGSKVCTGPHRLRASDFLELRPSKLIQGFAPIFQHTTISLGKIKVSKPLPNLEPQPHTLCYCLSHPIVNQKVLLVDASFFNRGPKWVPSALPGRY